MRGLLLLWAWAAAVWLAVSAVAHAGRGGVGEQPLSRIAVERVVLAVNDAAHVKASPLVLGHKVSSAPVHFSPPLLFGSGIRGSLTDCCVVALQGENSEWVDVEFFHPNPSGDDWIGVFSPANFRYQPSHGRTEWDRPNRTGTWGILFLITMLNLQTI
jgi:hypothetical protein